MYVCVFTSMWVHMCAYTHGGQKFMSVVFFDCFYINTESFN